MTLIITQPGEWPLLGPPPGSLHYDESLVLELTVNESKECSLGS